MYNRTEQKHLLPSYFKMNLSMYDNNNNNVPITSRVVLIRYKCHLPANLTGYIIPDVSLYTIKMLSYDSTVRFFTVAFNQH